MRIVLVSSHGADRTWGGAERYVAELADGLSRRGHEVTVVSARRPHDPSAERTVSLEVTPSGSGRVARWADHLRDLASVPPARLEALLRDRRPALLHTNNLLAIGTGAWTAAASAGVPVVHTLHDYHLLCPRTTLQRRSGAACHPSPVLCGLRTRRLARPAPGVRLVIGVSAHVARRHRAAFGTATPTAVIHPPIVAPAGMPRAAPVPGADGAGLAALGYLGTLSRPKGVETLIAASGELVRRGVTLHVAGSGPLADALATAPGITVHGRLQGAEVGRFIAGCDAGVVPSLWQEPGLTYALSEWLGAGRPVLVTGRGGLAEALGLGGVAQFDGSRDGLLAAVARLQEPGAFAELSASVPAYADDRDLERWLDDHERAYAVALGRSGAAPR